MSDNAAYVITRIQQAFADVELGDGVGLLEAIAIDDWRPDAVRMVIRAKDERADWTRIPDDLIACNPSALCFVDDAGMRFLLPAFMCFAVRNHGISDSVSVDSAVFALGRSHPAYNLFTAPQKAAVRHFLRFMAFNTGRGVGGFNYAERALNDVWLAGLRPKARPKTPLDPALERLGQ